MVLRHKTARAQYGTTIIPLDTLSMRNNHHFFRVSVTYHRPLALTSYALIGAFPVALVSAPFDSWLLLVAGLIVAVLEWPEAWTPSSFSSFLL